MKRTPLSLLVGHEQIRRPRSDPHRRVGPTPLQRRLFQTCRGELLDNTTMMFRRRLFRLVRILRKLSEKGAHVGPLSVGFPPPGHRVIRKVLLFGFARSNGASGESNVRKANYCHVRSVVDLRLRAAALESCASYPQAAPELDDRRIRSRLPAETTMGTPASVAFDAKGHLIVLNRGPHALLQFDVPPGLRASSYLNPTAHVWVTDVSATSSSRRPVIPDPWNQGTGRRLG